MLILERRMSIDCASMSMAHDIRRDLKRNTIMLTNPRSYPRTILWCRHMRICKCLRSTCHDAWQAQVEQYGTCTHLRLDRGFPCDVFEASQTPVRLAQYPHDTMPCLRQSGQEVLEPQPLYRVFKQGCTARIPCMLPVTPN